MTDQNKRRIKVTFQLYPIVLVLAILKMAGVINISWWWVLSPIFITMGLLASGILFLVFIGMIGSLGSRR